MKKKLLSLITLAGLTFALTGCGVNTVLPNSTGTNPIGGGPAQKVNYSDNITSSGEITELGKLVVIAKNGNNVAVDMEIEVEFYDANNTIVGNASEDLRAVGAGQEIAVDLWSTPDEFDNYKIYVDAEASRETQFFDKIELTQNNTGKKIAVQVKNNSDEDIEYITVGVVFYADGKVVGYADGIASDIKSGRSGNFTIDYPYDKHYKDIAFDDYKVFVNEAYSYNW